MKGQVKMRFRENGLEGNVLTYRWTLLDMVLVQEKPGKKRPNKEKRKNRSYKHGHAGTLGILTHKYTFKMNKKPVASFADTLARTSALL